MPERSNVELRLVDHVSKPLGRIAWKFQSWDGRWHPSYMKADRLRQKEPKT